MNHIDRENTDSQRAAGFIPALRSPSTSSRSAGINPPARCSDIRGLYFLAAAIAIIVFLLPLAIKFPLLDPDEGLHASIAQEMVEKGNWVVPHFLGKPFLDKPILYFWSQALSLRCFGMNEFAARLPGLLFGLLGSVTTAAVGWRMFGRTNGMIAGIFYGTMILPVALAQAAAHDVVIVPCVNLAILLFWEADRAKSWKTSTAFALLIGFILGIAILAKGLMGVALVGVAYGGYLLVARKFTLAACYRGALSLGIATGIASIWYLAAECRQPGYLHYYFVERHLLGFTTSTQTHGDAPWWLYIPTLLGGGLPWIGYLPVTIRELLSKNCMEQQASPGVYPRAWSRLKTLLSFHRPNEDINPTARFSSSPARLLWCWLLGCTIFLSLAQSKLVTYLWPVFPAVAILAAIGWSRLIEGVMSSEARQSLRKNFIVSSFSGPFVLPIAVFALQKAFGVHFGWPTWTAAILVGFSTLAPLWFLLRERWQALLTASVLSAAAQFFVVISLVLPMVAEVYSEKELAAHFNVRRADSPTLPAKMFFIEERIASFIFYLDPTLRASIVPDQLQEIPRPDIQPKIKQFCPPGSVIVVPQQRVERAGEYVDLEGLEFRKAGRFRLFQEK